jgi:multiple sugar transport system substrate-binding protein
MRRPALGILLAIALAGCVYLLVIAQARSSGSGRNEGPTTLRVANWSGPGNDPAFWKMEREIQAEFERLHPNVSVRMEGIPGPGQYVPKLLMTYVAGNPPDVIQLDASSAAVFINHDLLADMRPLLRDDKSFALGDYFENVLEIGRRGDRLFAAPLDFTPMVIVYNKKMFDAAKVPYPKSGWTREQFLVAAKALTDRSAGQYGFFIQREMPMWFPWVWSGGGDVLSADGRHAAGYLDGPRTLEAITFLVDLVKAHHVAPSLAESSAAGVDLFRAGKAAMTMTGHWALIEYRADQIDIGVAGIPRAADVSRITVMYASGLAISRASQKQQLAWEYIRFLTSESVQRKRVAGGLAISGNRRAAMSFAGNPVEDAFLEEAKYARPPWGSRMDRYEFVEDLGREMIEDIFNSGVPVKDAASRAAQLIEGELNRK